MGNKSLKWKVAQAAEIRWWENYLGKKDVKEYAEWKKNYWKRVLAKIDDVIELKEGEDVLDAGCGPAGMFMITQACNTDAVDPLLDGYEEKLLHFKKTLYPHTRFYSLPLEDFVPDKKYELIFCMNAINHVSDLKLSYDLLVQWLKPGGKLVITIDAHNYSFFKYLFRLVPGDILHPHQYDEQEYEAMLTSRNCSMLKTVRLKHEFFFDHVMMVAQKKN